MKLWMRSMAVNYPLKVLMTADPIGGVWTYALELAKYLRKYNVHITLAVMGAPLRKSQATETAKISNLEVLEGRYKLEWMEEPWEDVGKSGEWLLQLESSIQPDVVHLNGYSHGTLPWKTPLLITAHSCVLSWWESIKSEKISATWDTYKFYVGKGLENADMVTAPTQWMLDSIERHYGKLARKAVIYNGRSADDFYSMNKQRLIFSMGRIWDEAKNIQQLQKCARYINAPVCIAGDHGNKEVRNSKNTTFLGHLSTEEIAWWLAKASVYVLPVQYEPFGLTMLEAAYSGCALVVGDIPSMREVWGDAASYIPPDDTAALVNCCNQLLADEKMTRIMGNKAKERAKVYEPGKMAMAYFNQYNNIIRKKLMTME